MVSSYNANIIQSHQNSAPSKAKLIIRNQLSGFELASPMYVSHGATCYLSPDQKVDIDSTKVGFNIDPSQDKSISALMYKLQRKNVDEFNGEAVSSEDEATCIQLFIIWKVCKSGKIFVVSDLIEHDKDHVWNSDKLMKLTECSKLYDIQHGFIKKTWFMSDNTVLMTNLNITCEKEHCKLEIIISEGSINDNIQRPRYIPLDSALPQPTIKVNIYNQCANTKLVSPIYSGNGTIYPKLSEKQIDIGTKMKTCFSINTAQDKSEGILLFKLQREKREENRLSVYLFNLFRLKGCSNDEAKCVQMLIAWKMKDTKILSHVALVEHDKAFTWNENKLRSLYDENRGWLKEYNETIPDKWFMDDITLKTTLNKIDLKGILELNLSISEEEKGNNAMKPLCVHLKSLALQPLVTLNIHNQCKSISLTSPVYFIRGGKWHATPDHKIDANTIMRNYLEHDSREDILEGALIYRIQKRNTIFAKFFQESKHIQFLVVWRIEHTKELYIRALLIEHESELDEDKLRRLHQKHWYTLKTNVRPIKSDWVLNDGTMLTTTIITNEDHSCSIFITEGKDNSMKPLWIDVDSITPKKVGSITICNLYPDMELVSPIFYYNHECHYEYHVKKDTSDVIKIDLYFDQDDARGIMMCKMQRKSNTRSNHQYNHEETSKVIQFLVAWKITPFWVDEKIILVEHDDQLVINEDKLARLYDKVKNIPASDIISTWLIDDNKVLKVTCDRSIHKTNHELKITISKGVNGYDIRPNFWIDSTSLTIQSAMDITIDNRCYSIKLTSPVYFIKDPNCYIQFPQQMNFKSIMKANFMIGIDRDMFGGALLYHLQGEENTSVQLLVTWGYSSYGPNSHAQFIQQSTPDWDKDKLEALYDIYHNQHNACSNTGEWWLNNNTKLKTECAISFGFRMKVTISEVKV